MIFSILEKTGSKILVLLINTGSIASFFAQALYWLVSSKINFRNLFKQMYAIGVMSLPVVLTTGMFTGMVLAVQSYFQLRQFTVETSVATIIGLSMTRELGPVLTALMLAGRVGASMTAELGTMKVTEQLDALHSLASNPVKYLVVPRLISGIILTPILTIYAILIGIIGGYLISVKLFDVPSVFYLSNLQRSVHVSDVTSGLKKAVVFGLIIVLIGCYKGFNATGGAEGVGKATMQSVVLSSMLILISDFFLSVLLF